MKEIWDTGRYQDVLEGFKIHLDVAFWECSVAALALQGELLDLDLGSVFQPKFHDFQAEVAAGNREIRDLTPQQSKFLGK